LRCNNGIEGLWKPEIEDRRGRQAIGHEDSEKEEVCPSIDSASKTSHDVSSKNVIPHRLLVLHTVDKNFLYDPDRSTSEYYGSIHTRSIITSEERAKNKRIKVNEINTNLLLQPSTP